MPYIVDSVFVKPKVPMSAWETVNPNTVTLYDLSLNYSGAYINVNHTETPEFEGHLTLDDHIKDDLVKYGHSTVTEYLTIVGGRNLYAAKHHRTVQETNCLMFDPFRGGFHVKRHLNGYHVDNAMSRTEKTDLLIYNDKVDNAYLFDTHAVTVNGLFFNKYSSHQGLVVKDGAWQSDYTGLGMINLAPLGKHKYLPLSGDMVTTMPGQTKFDTDLYLNVGEDLTNKQVWLVFGGKLHIYDHTYKVVGGDTIKFNYVGVNPIVQYYETRDLIDLSSLPMTVEDNGRVWRSDIEESLDVIKAWFDLEHTFLIVIDNPNVYVRRRHLVDAGLYGKYYTRQEPNGLLFGLGGLCVPYWKQNDWGTWVVSIEHQHLARYLYTTYNYKQHDYVHNHKEPYRSNTRSRAFILDIGTQNL